MLRKAYIAQLHQHLDEMRNNGDLTETPHTSRSNSAVAEKPTKKVKFLRILTGKKGQSNTHWDS